MPFSTSISLDKVREECTLILQVALHGRITGIFKVPHLYTNAVGFRTIFSNQAAQIEDVMVQFQSTKSLVSLRKGS